jgi:hypothetical protein
LIVYERTIAERSSENDCRVGRTRNREGNFVGEWILPAVAVLLVLLLLGIVAAAIKNLFTDFAGVEIEEVIEKMNEKPAPTG